MATTYELEPLTSEEISHWDDLTVAYPNRELFHRRAWLDYLAESRGVEVRYWTIRRGAEKIGYFCGGVVRKGPFKIFGSPLKGWGTNFLGPLHHDVFDTRAFLLALDDLARDEGFAVVEIEGRSLQPAEMETANYVAAEQKTYVVRLTPSDQGLMWKQVDRKTRSEVRKAIRSGLVVEDAEGPGFVNEFFDQFVEVLARKNLYPPYTRRCVSLMVDHLQRHGLLFALQVRDAAGRMIATGLLPHDEKTVYLWGAASRIEGWRLCPNDLLQWTVMERAARQGLADYNMCGYGHFKSKFGGTLQYPKRWHKFYSGSARWARKGYEFYFTNRVRLRGWWENVARRQSLRMR